MKISLVEYVEGGWVQRVLVIYLEYVKNVLNEYMNKARDYLYEIYNGNKRKK